VLLALNTGMRRGELLSLEWQRVDLIHGRIRILNAKTKSSARSIPLNAISYALLCELAQKKKSNLVFPSNRKVGERFFDLKKGFKKAVQLARIAPIRFHDLRHTFATRLVQAGVDIITVQHLLGHAKISVTARYAHSPDNARVAAVKRLDELFSSQSAPNRPPEVKMGGEVARHKPQQVNTLGP
jgi:integrase